MSRNGLDGPHAVKQLPACNEWNAETRSGQHDAGIPRIVLHVMDAALDGANGDRICDEIGLQARLDDKQSADLA